MGFADVFRAAEAVPAVLRFDPATCEGMDDRLANNLRHEGIPERRYLHFLPRGGGWLLIKLVSDDATQLRQRARALAGELCSAREALEVRIVEAPEEREGLWKVREAGLGATAFVPGQRDTWPGWEDSAVAPERLGSYLRDLDRLFHRYGYAPALYGHFGQGLVHCRVPFDLTTAAGLAQYRSFAVEAADLCAGEYGGSLSGEHGDGQARGWLLDRMFGPELAGAMREFKAIWDPEGMMNPGKLVDPAPMTAQLRLGASYDPAQPDTHFRFPQDEGSFARATLRCVGVGKCRREHAHDQAPEDVMCPSFMATREEKHSTRGRAHLLWEMMRGGDSPIRGGFRDPHVKEALDLCLACKGCKNDCPVNVDVATYKAEIPRALLARATAPALRLCVRVDRQVVASGSVRAAARQLADARVGHGVAGKVVRGHGTFPRGAALSGRDVRGMVSPPAFRARGYAPGRALAGQSMRRCLGLRSNLRRLATRKEAAPDLACADSW